MHTNNQVVRAIPRSDLDKSGCFICGYKRIVNGITPHHLVCTNCEAQYVGNENSAMVDVLMPVEKSTDSYYQLVTEFQDWFGITQDASLDKPGIPPFEVFEFKWNHIKEELNELADAFEQENLEEMADAIVDTIYVLLGLASNMNLPFDRLFKAVHEANMKKKRVEVPSDSKRNCRFDVIKPENWQPADLNFILKCAGAEIK